MNVPQTVDQYFHFASADDDDPVSRIVCRSKVSQPIGGPIWRMATFLRRHGQWWKVKNELVPLVTVT
jgi:hypothetical protein